MCIHARDLLHPSKARNFHDTVPLTSKHYLAAEIAVDIHVKSYLLQHRRLQIKKYKTNISSQII